MAENSNLFDFGDFDFNDFDSLNTDFNTDTTQPEPTPDVSNIVTKLIKRAMVVIFIVDTSGSMRGARIGAVNDAIRNLIPELKKREKSNTTAEIRVALMQFSNSARWLTESPIPVSTYQFSDIDSVSGGTNYSSAFRALNDKLTDSRFMKSSAGAYTPLIIFLTDGKPSDMGLYHEELDNLKKNKWFKNATRAGIAIEEGALSQDCKNVLLEFTGGNTNNVYEAKDTIILAKQINLVTLTGVEFVTQQGSLQGSANHAPRKEKSVPSSANNLRRPNEIPDTRRIVEDEIKPLDLDLSSLDDQSENEDMSPTVPIGDIDWDKDWSF